MKTPWFNKYVDSVHKPHIIGATAYLRNTLAATPIKDFLHSPLKFARYCDFRFVKSFIEIDSTLLKTNEFKKLKAPK